MITILLNNHENNTALYIFTKIMVFDRRGAVAGHQSGSQMKKLQYL